MQFSSTFGETHRHSLFEKMQRHQTAGKIASAVTNRPASFEALTTSVNDPTFLLAWERATENPDSLETKKKFSAKPCHK